MSTLNNQYRKTGSNTMLLSVDIGRMRASKNIAIVGVMKKRSDLSDDQKGMIIDFRAEGGSISERFRFVNYSHAAVINDYGIYQQDNAKCHAAGNVRTWFEKHQEQLATALDSAWLNISVNTFRNLIDSLAAHLAAVHFAKGGYSGF
ncbi:DDE_3 domain-containing protein [Trichonephila clavipes]|nr:DDE_3 domain-containing protein [Trichonephila clavipes]